MVKFNDRRPVVFEKVHVVLSCDFCGRRDMILSLIEDKWVCPHCKLVLVEINPILRMTGKVLSKVEAGVISLHKKVLNSKLVVDSAQSVLSDRLSVIMAMRECSRYKIRLFAREGQHLSRHADDKISRWYTSPVTAFNIDKYNGRLTERLVYIDVELDMLSPVNRRFYQLGDEAFTFNGELISVVKRKWKYATPEVIAQTNTFIAHRQASAGLEAELENTRR